MKISGFRLNPAGIRELFLSEWCNDLCYKRAKEHMPTSAAWINSNAHSPLRNPVKAKSKRLGNTCIGLVVPANKAAANIAYKYGMK